MDDFTFVSIEWVVWAVSGIVLFWLSPVKYRSQIVSLVTFSFLFWVDKYSCLILVLMALLCFIAVGGRQVSQFRNTVSVLLIIAALLIYKAVGSGLSLNSDFFTVGVIPLGLSFYSLRCMHVIFERGRGNLGQVSLSALIPYLFFLPTIWMGPIHRFSEFERDRRRHRWDYELFSQGLERIIYGYVKVVIISGFFLELAWPHWVVEITSEQSQFWQYLELVRGGLNLYLLFSGYSDIAIGLAYTLGYKVGENFAMPYLAKNISEFWRRWHISLTSWSNEYIYKYFMANTRSASASVLASLLVIGVWHELSLRYFAWGVYHWLGILCWQGYTRLKPILPSVGSVFWVRVWEGFCVLLTVHFVWLGFLLVGQVTFSDMSSVLNLLFLGR
ncbi:MBOAT family O-acyltransferase [Microbulbifer sp. JMSA004]|uniref:MBOAT family O-acyltransferase n=1 Tax=unclassified Microbulbifer TaxID=2619833 RepID=UPI0024AD96CD|nr:MBOAT family O-acyltransferase [Microbulbifer sp. VAAF005]WHI48263.1 hypothetical protein P0078_07780 [Microbulbifer sp. VAAF005]